MTLEKHTERLHVKQLCAHTTRLQRHIWHIPLLRLKKKTEQKDLIPACPHFGNWENFATQMVSP